MHKIEATTLTDDLISDITARNSVLWLTAETFSSASEIESLARLITAPWRAVFVEATSGDFASRLESQDQSAESFDSSGAFSHLIASDPLALVLQRRAKPVFFLNGRADRAGAEASALPKRSAERRRLNMTARLRDLEPRRVFVVGHSPKRAIEDLVDLWDAEFRSLLTIVTSIEERQQAVIEQLDGIPTLKVVHFLLQTDEQFAKAITARLGEHAVSTTITVSVRLPGDAIVNVDLSSAELVEQPISDLCRFIRISDTLPVSPDDLREDEFQEFFSRNQFSWRPFAAGLPWIANPASEKELLKGLRQQLSDPPGSVQLYTVV